MRDDPYATRAARFGEHVRTYRDRILHSLMSEALIPFHGMRLLDLAAGQGDSSLPFAKAGAVTWHVDRSLPMLRKGIDRGLVRRESAIVADLTADRFPLRRASMDAALIRYALHDVADLISFLHEVRRVLRPSGRLQVVDVASEEREVLCFLDRIHGMKTQGPPRRCWFRRPSELLRAIERTGFGNPDVRWHTNTVLTVDWLSEGQISACRYREISLILEEACRHRSVPAVELDLGRSAGGFEISFPVLVLTAQVSAGDRVQPLPRSLGSFIDLSRSDS